MTQNDAVLKFLNQHSPGWVPSYILIHHELCGVWVGNRGDRTARDWFAKGKVDRKEGRDLINQGIKVDFTGKQIDPKYTYFKGKKQTVEYLPDGSVRLSYQ